MDETEIRQLFIDILYACLNETDNNDSIKQRITSDGIQSVYRLAKQHDLAHVVSKFIYQNSIEIDGKLKEQLQYEEMISVYRNEQMKYALGVICEAFDEAGIAYIPLKGSAIRPYYPYENMRTSFDIDVLVHEYDIDAAIKCLESKGYRCGKRNYHDVSLYAPGKIHLELHFNIQENTDKLDVILKDVWEYTVQVKDYQYAFSKEFFAFYLFAHMKYHFAFGGCGIRFLLDIWVMEQKMGVSYLCAKELLERADIYQFASEMSKLADLCFTQNDSNVSDDIVLKYILKSTVHGSMENHIVIDKSKAKSPVLYAIKRLFLPYKSMTILYPFLKKTPYLLPFCWIARWINVFATGKSKRIFSEMACAKNTSDENVKEVNAVFSRLGLK